MKQIGAPANRALAEYRAAIDMFIAALSDLQRPFSVAIQTLHRIRELPITSPEILANGTRETRKAVEQLRGYLRQAKDTPAGVSEGLLMLERNLIQLVEKEAHQR